MWLYMQLTAKRVSSSGGATGKYKEQDIVEPN